MFNHTLKNKNLLLLPKYNLGQNFLIKEHILFKIISTIKSISKLNTYIIEFGCGLGALTKILLQNGFTTYSIDISKKNISLLNNYFSHYIHKKKLILYNEDLVHFQFYKKFLKTSTSSIICGNLPYNLTSNILYKILFLFKLNNGCVFVLQKEVILSLSVNPYSQNRNILSLFCNDKYFIRSSFFIPNFVFFPKPNVNSGIILFVPKEYNLYFYMNLFIYKKIILFTIIKHKKLINSKNKSIYIFKRILKHKQVLLNTLTISNHIKIMKIIKRITVFYQI